MRACFLGQSVCALGYGVAVVQMPRLPERAPEQADTNCAGTGFGVAVTLPEDQWAPVGLPPETGENSV